MDQQKRLSFALLFSLLFAFIYLKLIYEPKYTTPVKKDSAVVQSSQAPIPSSTSTGTTSSSNPTQANEVQGTLPKASLTELESSGTIKVINQFYEAVISKKGGKLVSLKLLKYNTHLKNPEHVDLVDSIHNLFPLTLTNGKEDDSLVDYKIESTDGIITNDQLIVGESQNSSLVLSGNINNTTVKKSFKFYGDRYDFDLKAEGLDSINLPFKLHPEEKLDHYNPRNLMALNDKNKIIHSLENALKFESQPVAWIGFGDKYFFSGIISNNETADAVLTTTVEDANVTLKNKTNSYKLYFGPKNKPDLIITGFNLYRAIDLGFFAIIADPILSLLTLFYTFIHNYGLAVILVTLVIKLLLLPLTATSFKSMKAMQSIQPEMNALKEKIKDQTVLQQEILKLYQKNGVNPLGGCLPMLLQLPIFFGLLSAFQNSLALRHANFALWIKDLSAPESLHVFGMPFPVLTLLFAGSIYLQQLSMPSANIDPMQKKMMLFMPLIFIVMMFIYPVPSALILYYLVSNLISFVQQKLLRDGQTGSAFKATILASIGIFLAGFLVTLI